MRRCNLLEYVPIRFCLWGFPNAPESAHAIAPLTQKQSLFERLMGSMGRTGSAKGASTSHIPSASQAKCDDEDDVTATPVVGTLGVTPPAGAGESRRDARKAAITASSHYRTPRSALVCTRLSLFTPSPLQIHFH